METKANFVLVGAVTLIAIIGALGFFLWLARVQIDKSYAQYDVIFDSVEGLARGSSVRFNGVDVGQVLTVELSRADPSRVRVRIEVGADTPIRQGTVARRESQGVTGVSFVGLEGGAVDAARLPPDPDTGVPVIPSEASVVEGLIEDAPDLLREATDLLRDLSAFANDENRKAVANILANVDTATARLDDAMTDFAELTESVGKGVDQITAFTARLDEVADKAEATLANAEAVLARAKTFSETGLPEITNATTEASRLIEALRRVTAQIERDPARFFLGNRTPEYSR